MYSESFEQLMKAVGPALEPQALIRQEEDDFLLILKEVVIRINHSVEREQVELSCILASPEEHNRADVLESMMLCNYLLEESGGVVVGTNALGGEPVQSCSYPAHNLDIPAFLAIVNHFVEKVNAWNEIIQLGGQPTRSDAFEKSPEGSHIIRV